MIKQFLEKNEIQYSTNVDLKEFSNFKTGGIAEFIVSPQSISQLQSLLIFLKEKNILYKIIGFKHDDKQRIVTVGSGKSLGEFVEWCVENGIAGFECLGGIPGTIGGALTMNAGAYGQFISDNLIRVNCLNSEGQGIIYTKEQLNYSYRDSLFRQNPKLIIIDAEFSIRKGNNFRLAYKKDLLDFKRKKYNDYAYPSLGSLFATLDLYKDIGKVHPRYFFLMRIILKVLKIWRLNNYKRINNRKIENAFTEWYFKFSFDKQPYSDKTLNCLTNKSQGTKELLEYIWIIRNLVNHSVEIENEILTPNFKNLSNEANWYPYFP